MTFVSCRQDAMYTVVRSVRLYTFIFYPKICHTEKNKTSSSVTKQIALWGSN